MKIITLPCQLSEALYWDPLIQNIGPDEEIFWKFDLGLNVPYFPLEDEMMFQGLKLALTHFSNTIWPQFEHRTKGASFYQGSIDFSQFFIWSEKQEENFSLWINSRPLLSLDLQKKIFCANAFVQYGQMLAHSLPDEMPLYWFLDAKYSSSRAEAWQILSKERFEHFSLAVRNLSGWDGMSWDDHKLFFSQNTSQQAVCFPEEASLSSEILSALEAILEEHEGDMKVIFEPFLTESWEGIDQIYVVSRGVSPRGKRKLMGFCATGGTVIVEGDSLGLPLEVLKKEVRGRGI